MGTGTSPAKLMHGEAGPRAGWHSSGMRALPAVQTVRRGLPRPASQVASVTARMWAVVTAGLGFRRERPRELEGRGEVRRCRLWSTAFYHRRQGWERVHTTAPPNSPEPGGLFCCVYGGEGRTWGRAVGSKRPRAPGHRARAARRLTGTRHGSTSATPFTRAPQAAISSSLDLFLMCAVWWMSRAPRALRREKFVASHTHHNIFDFNAPLKDLKEFGEGVLLYFYLLKCVFVCMCVCFDVCVCVCRGSVTSAKAPGSSRPRPDGAAGGGLGLR